MGILFLLGLIKGSRTVCVYTECLCGLGTLFSSLVGAF